MKLFYMLNCKMFFIFGLIMSSFLAFGLEHSEECSTEVSSLNGYEAEILRAAGKKDLKALVPPLVCVLEMQDTGSGFNRYMASSFLAPFFGAPQPNYIKVDPRYKIVAETLQKIIMKSENPIDKSFMSKFNDGDWGFYTLFCEDGDTSYCTTFLPKPSDVQTQPPLIAAASILRLWKAYKVLPLGQREAVATRLRKLYRSLPKDASVQRHFINKIYLELSKQRLS